MGEKMVGENVCFSQKKWLKTFCHMKKGKKLYSFREKEFLTKRGRPGGAAGGRPGGVPVWLGSVTSYCHTYSNWLGPVTSFCHTTTQLIRANHFPKSHNLLNWLGTISLTCHTRPNWLGSITSYCHTRPNELGCSGFFLGRSTPWLYAFV